jgi:aspartyl-tRNA(Asn)/glutamyl-tRNA(Gln) amidotransferase subunit B
VSGPTLADYELVVGLECHVELSTRTKMFCGCANQFGGPPNTNVCPVCLGHPGSLPVPNERAIEYIVRIGLALGSEIAPRSLFHRKNYFYPDMPKNYQISQYDLPVCIGGHLKVELDGRTRKIGITRVHMEEDTGKTTHVGTTGRISEAEYALIDYNRAGVPLVECVSEPDMRSPEEAAAYLRELRGTIEALGVSDVRMEEGSLRCDANVSVRARSTAELGTKVEIKNMNSIRSLERAIRYEHDRQVRALEAGEMLVQETRHWNEDQGVTTSMRSKEEAFDYRYFPEPDIPPLEPDRTWVDALLGDLPELPAVRRARYASELGLGPEAARILAATAAWAEFFEETVALGADAVAAANWITQDVAGLLAERRLEIDHAPISPTHVADLVHSIAGGTIASAQGKIVLVELFGDPNREDGSTVTERSVDDVIRERGLLQMSGSDELGPVVDEVIAENPDPVEQVRKGKDGAVGFLVGQVMKKTKGSANPKIAGDLLRERLSS